MSNTHPFFSPVLRGGRFDNHALPLEFLKDLTIFEEILSEIAKHEFKLSNTERQRIPRNFNKGLELCISDIEHGSTILKVVFTLTTTLAQTHPNIQYYELARDKFVNAVVAASEGKSVREFIPDSVAGYFEQFGRGLRDDETIELSGADTKTCFFTNRVRKTILSEFKRTEFEEECVIRGYVPEMNQDAKSCQILLCHDDSKVTINYDRYEQDVRLAFNSYLESRSAIQISGTGTFSVHDNRLQKIKSVSGILLLEPLDVSVQIDKLKKLNDGWLDGEGKAPDHEALSRFMQTWDTYWVDSLPLPYIYPTPEGGIQAEWSIERYAISLEIEFPSQKSYYHQIHLDTKKDLDMDLDLTDQVGWETLKKTLQQVTKEDNK